MSITVAEAVTGRRSIRAFLDKPVPLDLLERVLERAQMAPSGYNFQPWESVVLSGEPMRELSAKLKASQPQEPAEYQLVPKGLPQFYKDRRDATVAKRMEAAGIAAMTRPAAQPSSSAISSSTARRRCCSPSCRASWASHSGRTSACGCRR